MNNEALEVKMDNLSQKMDEVHSDIKKVNSHFEVPDGCVPKMMQRMNDLEEKHFTTRRMVNGMWILIVAIISAIGGLFWNHISAGYAVATMRHWLRI